MIAGVDQEETSRLLEVFRRESKIEQVILYGSRAKGTYRPGSDIDLTLKGDKLTLDQLADLAGEIDDLLLPYRVDLSIYHQITNKDLIEHIERVGQVIFKR